MRLLHKHPNVISLTNLWSRDEDNELYITMELMDSDLHQIIQSKQSLSEPHHQCLMKQLLLGVQAMHKLGVLHRDLKPGNLLVTRDCQLRITDFGLARAWDRSTPDAKESAVGAMTEYVVTRWYRCPELLLAPHIPYDGAIDLWSVGCIFGELLNRRPLFPGKSYVHQVQVILDVLGTPTEADFGFKPRDDAAAFLKRQRHRNGVTFQQLLPAASERALKFLGSLLTWDPKKRLTVDQALAHPWLSDAPALPCKRCSVEELLASRGDIDFKFEDPATPLPLLKNLVYKEIEIFTGAAEAEAAKAEAAKAAKAEEMAAADAGRVSPGLVNGVPRPGTAGSVGSMGSLGRGLGGKNRPASPTPSSNAQATVAGAIGMAQKSVPISETGGGSSSSSSSSSSRAAAAATGSENVSHSGNVVYSQQQQQQQQQQQTMAGNNAGTMRNHNRALVGGGGGGGGALVRRQAGRMGGSRGGYGVGPQGGGGIKGVGNNASLANRAKAMKEQMMNNYSASSIQRVGASASSQSFTGQQSSISGGKPRRSLPNIQNGIATLANRTAASKHLFSSSSARAASSNGSSAVNDPLRAVRRATSGGVGGSMRGR